MTEERDRPELNHLLREALAGAAREPFNIEPIYSDNAFTFVEGQLDLRQAAEAFLAAVQSYNRE